MLTLVKEVSQHSYGMFTAEVGKRVRKQEEQDPVCFRVDEMESEGKGTRSGILEDGR